MLGVILIRQKLVRKISSLRRFPSSSYLILYPIKFNCESMIDAPKTLLNDVRSTFVGSLDSRMNSSISLTITKHVTIPAAERSAIVDILSSSILKRVAIMSITTRFRMLASDINTITSSSASSGSCIATM